MSIFRRAVGTPFSRPTATPLDRKSASGEVVPKVPPQSVSACFVSGAGAVGETLIATPGVWIGATSVTGEWYVDDVASGNLTVEYTVQLADIGKNIHYLETAINSYGSVLQNSDITTIVFTPDALYVTGKQGFWGDPRELSTLRQTGAGVSPVTKHGDPSGLVLDNSRRLMLGPELVTNGDFHDTSAWFGNAGAAAAISGGKLNFVNAPNGASVLQFGGSKGKRYAVTFDIEAFSSGVVRFSNNDDTSPMSYAQFTAVGACAFYPLSVGSFATLASISSRAASTNAIIDNVSIRELPGNHAAQGSAANRPTYNNTADLHYLVYDGISDRLETIAGGGSSVGFLLCVALRVPAAGDGMQRVIWSDRGANTGIQLEVNAANAIVFSVGNGSTYTNVIGDVLLPDVDYVITAYYDGQKLSVQVNNFVETTVPFSAATAGVNAVSIGASKTPNAWYHGRMYNIVWVRNDGGTPEVREHLKQYVAETAGVVL